MRLRVVAVAVAASGIIGGTIGAGVALVLDGDGGQDNATVATAEDASTTTPATTRTVSQDTGCLDAADIYEQVRPSVVVVTSAAGRSEGTGTGIVIDEEGHVLTNYHVVSGASNIEVQLADGSVSAAEVLGADPANDLAVIRTTGAGLDLVPAKLGDSDSLRVGDPVLALGNPFTLEGTLTRGIVSALGRTYATGATTRPIRGMIQTDAAVNPGNSGGPLLDCHGDVVGINTLLENPTGESVNVGVAFAVAVKTAKQSLPEMLAGETVGHPWLGIAGADVTPALAEELGLDADSGVYVTLVSRGSPADDAGLEGAFATEDEAAGSATLRRGGDVILAADGRDVAGIDDLAEYLDQNKEPGDRVELTVRRDGSETTVEARLSEWPG
jgi:S1-C subfamily serine protease